jgi:hypothetical protein
MGAPEARPRRSKVGGNRGKDLLQNFAPKSADFFAHNERFAIEDYRSSLALTMPDFVPFRILSHVGSGGPEQIREIGAIGH